MSRWRFPQRVGGKMSDSMFIACIIGASIMVLAMVYAVILFIAVIIDQHKWEREHGCDEDESSDGEA